MIDWKCVIMYNNLNEMWDLWKYLLVSVIDKYVLFRIKRVKNKWFFWIINELLYEIYKRDFLKKKVVFINDFLIWKQFKDVRNKVNNLVKKVKCKYFFENFDVNKSDFCKIW